VLLLDAPLPERPDMDVPGRPLLEMEVRRDDGPDVSAPVGETDMVGDSGWCSSTGDLGYPKSRLGISDTAHKKLYKERRFARTSFYFICFCVIPNIRCFRFCDFHQTVLADLCQSEIFFIPLQATVEIM